MKNLAEILTRENYRKIKFRISRTNHLLIRASINNVPGNFILDTGASNSCVDTDGIVLFQLSATHSETKAAGAGATGMLTKLSRDNSLKIGRWQDDAFDLVVFDMSHVNAALVEHKARPVQGIIGADILMKGKAVIDYFNHYLYLQK